MQILSPRLMTGTDFPDDVIPPPLRSAGPLSPPQSSGSMDSFSTDSESEPPSERQGTITRHQIAAVCPRSPSTPMPVVPHSLKPQISRLLINKPVPPTPELAPVTIVKSPARSPLMRSMSDSSQMASAASRTARRRPIMLSDSTSLSTLSVFIDSSSLPASDLPGLYRSYDVENVRSPIGRRSDKVKQLTGDDDAQAFHNARLAQAALPWFLQPSYTRDDIKMDYDGSVRAGTLSALVERLTVDPLSTSSYFTVPRTPLHCSLDLVQENLYRHAFLTTFHTFSDADEIFTLLIQRYRLNAPDGLTPEEFDEWKEKKQRPVQKRYVVCFEYSRYLHRSRRCIGF